MNSFWRSVTSGTSDHLAPHPCPACVDATARCFVPRIPPALAIHGRARDPSVARAASSADRPWIGVPSALLSIGHGAHQTFIGTSNRLRIGTSILVPPRTTSSTSAIIETGGRRKEHGLSRAKLTSCYECTTLLAAFYACHLFDCVSPFDLPIQMINN